MLVSKIFIGIKDTYLFYYSILEFPYSDSVVNTSLADLFEFRSQYYSLVVSCSGFSKLECFLERIFNVSLKEDDSSDSKF